MTSNRRDAESRIRLRHLLRRGFANGIFKKREDYGRGALLVNVADLYSPNAVVDDSKLERVEVTTDELAKFGVHEGDIFFVRSSLKLDGIAVAARAGAAQEPRVFECHVVGVRPDTGRIDPRFLTYQLNAEPVRSSTVSQATTTTMTTISQDHLADIRVWCPPLGVQRRIADYLDAEVSRIDALTNGKQHVLDLLAEKRKAIISTAVTRGLDPKVRLRDSGVPWLGEIPAHWDVTRLKFHLNGITQGWSPQCEAIPASVDEWGVLKAGCVNGDTFNAEENKRLPEHDTPRPEIEVYPGDVVMSRANTTDLVGSAAIVPADVRSKLMLSDKLYRPQVKTTGLIPAYLVYFLRTASGRFDFERTASGASNSMQNISQEVVRNLWLPVPLIEEQRAVVEHISGETAKLDAVRVATERTIALLKERRAALIAAAVTGQLDVGAAA